MLVLSNFLLWSPFIILQQLSTTTIVISWQRSFTKASWSVIGRQWLSFKSESIPFRAEWQEMTLRVYPKFQSNFTQYETFLCPWKLLLFHVVTRALVCLFLSMFFSRPLLKSWSADQLKCLACTKKKGRGKTSSLVERWRTVTSVLRQLLLWLRLTTGCLIHHLTHGLDLNAVQ